MAKNHSVVQAESVVVKFAGDSGDGMQLAGTMYADISALIGNDLATFPYYPAEIRPPQDTVAGVSGFQVNKGANIKTSGDECDILVCMNPASLAANFKFAKKGGTIIIDSDSITPKALEKAGYKSNPLEDGSLSSFTIIKAPMTSISVDACQHLDIDNKSAARTKNMFALGMVVYICDYDLEKSFYVINKKFKGNPTLALANKAAAKAGYIFAEASEINFSRIHTPVTKIEKGRYRTITGNIATAWGLLAASEKSGRQLFLGSYPITPATEILMELAKHKSLGAKVFQAEDEIGGICSAIGASYAGALACTTTSGPGLSLKTEALGLAVIAELPLVVVDVQRGGPSTGLPTKSEQSDLYMALFGRNGEAPLFILAASSPSDCFIKAFEAAKFSMEHMTPAILLTDGQMGQGSEIFKIPKMAELPAIKPPIVPANDKDYKPYLRNPETLARGWAIPGTEGLRHRIGGLEKTNVTGNVSTDPMNHELMVKLRADKVTKIADYIPEQTIDYAKSGDLLVVSWGGTKGSVSTAVGELFAQGMKVGHAHFSYISPLPKNTGKVLGKFKKIIVCELNAGQFVNYLRMNFPKHDYLQYNKIQGLPFTTLELKEQFTKLL